VQHKEENKWFKSLCVQHILSRHGINYPQDENLIYQVIYKNGNFDSNNLDLVVTRVVCLPYINMKSSISPKKKKNEVERKIIIFICN
jgi:hypothetical protein